MAEKSEDYYSLGDIINHAKAFIRYLLKKWWMLAIAMIIGAALGALYYNIQKPKYEAVTTFILEEKSGGGGGLAGLASQFGFNIGSLSGGGSMFAGDNILNILKSKNIVQKVLLSPAEGNSPKETLADLYLDFSGLKKHWQKKPQLANIIFSNIQGTITPLQDSVLNAIYEALIKKNVSVERTSKQGSIIRVTVTAANSTFARLMSVRLVDEAGKMYMEIKTGTAEANIQQLQNRSDSLLFLLNRKSYTAAASQPLDINPAIKTAVVPTEIASRDKTVLATLYAEVTKNLEASKLLLSQQTPVIEVLDRPSYLQNDNRMGLLLLIIVSIVALCSMCIIGLLFLFVVNRTT